MIVDAIRHSSRDATRMRKGTLGEYHAPDEKGIL